MLGIEIDSCSIEMMNMAKLGRRQLCWSYVDDCLKWAKLFFKKENGLYAAWDS